MATWQDGPEYAPIERPESYEPADVPPLTAEAKKPDMASAVAVLELPAERPTFDAADGGQRPLSDFGPPKSAERDASAPFEVVAAIMTSGFGQGGSLGLGGAETTPFESHKPLEEFGNTRGSGFNPRAPISIAARANAPAQLVLDNPPDYLPFDPVANAQQLPPDYLAPAYPVYPPSDTRAHEPKPPAQGYLLPDGQIPYGQVPPGAPYGNAPFNVPPPGYPAPGTPGWFGPGYSQPPRQHKKVTVQKVLEVATPGVMVAIFVGGMLEPFSALMFILSFVLSSRIRYRPAQIRTAYIVGAIIIALAGAGALVWSFSFQMSWVLDALNAAALWICRIEFWVIPFIIYRALAARERPDGR
ncbi:MAG: hypothetical protein LBU38_06390 [Propionibacteriaceae bacterium]|jgi:hypothetical protein|nr:hypothetical protein [Propionibacteriaceae bacterium]